jgi:hypothetical protein
MRLAHTQKQQHARHKQYIIARIKQNKMYERI